MCHLFCTQRKRIQGRAVLSMLVCTAVGLPAFAFEAKARPQTFVAAPLEIHARLPDLQMGSVPDLHEAERKFLATVWQGKSSESATPVEVEHGFLLDALLLASGIKEVEARQKYHKQFDALLAKAEQATEDAKNNHQRGEQLMKFLHRSVMNKGYKRSQTSLAAVFDTGKYNCVSSTAMYYLVGARLGMQLRLISIPGTGYQSGHASLDLIEGNNRIQIEPTNPNGFDWQTKVKRPGVIVVGYVPDRKRGHEVDALGLAAMIYANRGVELVNEHPPKRLEAAQCYLAALTLDPADASVSNNLLAVFVNWGSALTDEKKFDDAVRVLSFGLEIAPMAKPLHNNHRVAWAKHIDSTLDVGDDEGALKVGERAAAALPEDADFQSPSLWFRRHGEKHVQKKDWEAGLAVVDRGLKVLPAAEGEKLLRWRSSVFRRWSQTLLVKRDVAGSMQVLSRAYALNPMDRQIIAGIAYHAQQALPIKERESLEAMVAHFNALREQFDNAEEISEKAKRHAARAIKTLADAQNFQEAVEAVDKYGALLATAEHRGDVGGIAYDRWARHLAHEQKWKESLKKYKEGLAVFPRQNRLWKNGVATVDAWASPAIKAKNWNEAIRCYKYGLELFEEDPHLQSNLRYCKRMKGEPND